MPLELSQPVIEGLLHLGVDIPIELSRKLIANTVKMTLYPDASIPPDPEINTISSIKKSRSESAIVTLFALATKHCYDSQKMRLLLEQQHVNKLAIEDITKAFEDNRKEFFFQQLQIANTFPHITDVQWNIACDVKSSTSDCSSGEMTFHINLGNYQSHTGQRDTVVEFLCNTEELQSLLNKLREIERHCENIANK